MCKKLKVSRSGFYAWSQRKKSPRAESDTQLLSQIRNIFDASSGRYGSPRIHQKLAQQGVHVSRKRVARLMKEANLSGLVVRVTKRHPGQKRFHAKGTNLLLGKELPSAINQVWVADITYIRVKGKWQYLATVMDAYSRRIIGWSLSKNKSMKLTSTALKYALKRRNYPRDVLFHTDRGVEFTGSTFQKLLNKYEFKHSLNRAGQCTDNAFMESFYHSLKCELIRGTVFESVQNLRSALQVYINKFYNTVRLHSGIEYKPPVEYEMAQAS